MAILTVVEPSDAGNDPQYVTPTVTTGDQYAVDNYTVFHVRNSSGAAITVTFNSTAGAELGIAPANKVVNVPAGANRDVRLKPSHRFRDANGRATAICSAVVTVQVAVTRIA